jgi:hypothetical protein
MILKVIHKTQPIQQKYSAAVYATVLDPTGEEIQLTMYGGKWDSVDVGNTYQSFNVQMDSYVIDGQNQLRTIAATRFIQAPQEQQIPHQEDLTKRVKGVLVSFHELRMYFSCPKCCKSVVNMQNEVCPNDRCNAIIEDNDKVQDFMVKFVFEEEGVEKEFEHICSYQRSLKHDLLAYTSEVELTENLHSFLDRKVSIRFSRRRNKDDERIIENIKFD